MLAGVFGLALLACLLVYFPPVQRFAVRKASEAVHRSTGMTLAVDKFRLRFPLGVSADGFSLVTPQGDTLAAARKVRVDAGLLPLLRGTLRAGISLADVSSTYLDTVSTMLLRARVGELKVDRASLRFKTHAVRISRAELSGALIRLETGPGQPPADTIPVADTSATAPWRFYIRALDLKEVDFAMRMSPSGVFVSALLPSGRVRRADVDLGAHDVGVGRVYLDGGAYEFIPGEPAEKAAETDPQSVADTIPWSVNVGSVKLDGNSFAFGRKPARPRRGFDPSYIRVENLDLLAADASYRGDDISVALRRLTFAERSGLRIVRGEGFFRMENGAVSIADLTFETPDSHITARAEAGEGILTMNPLARIEASVAVSAGAADIFRFVQPSPALARLLAGRPLTVGGDFSGTLGDVEISRVEASSPGLFDLSANGTVASINDPANLNGRLAFRGSVTGSERLRGAIADTALRRRIGFPRQMTFSGRGSFAPDRYELTAFELTARGANTGRLTAAGSFDTRRETFEARLATYTFPVGDFLPHDSLGQATFTLAASGRGFDPARGMNAELDLNVDSLDFRGYSYHKVALDARIADGLLRGNLESNNEALSLDLDLCGRFTPERYSASAAGDIWRADLRSMGFSEEPLAFTTEVVLGGSFAPGRDTLDADVKLMLDSTVVKFGPDSGLRVDRTILKAAARDSVTMALRSGDLTLDFYSSVPTDSLASGFASAAREVKKQLAARLLDVEAFQRSLPGVRLTARAGKNNFVRDLALRQKMDFDAVAADVNTSNKGRFGAGVEVNGLKTEALTLDTLNLYARRFDDRLQYALRLANRPGNVELLSLIYVYGYAGGNEARLNVYQRNRADSVGFRFGIDAQLLDDGVSAAMIPAEPVLGYEKWTVNGGNYVKYLFDGGLAADLRLRGPGGKHIDILSADLKDAPHGALRLWTGGLEIAHALDLLPTAPPLGGTLSTDLTFGIGHRTVAAQGTLGVDGFSYDGRRIADIAADLDFQSDTLGRMILDAHIDLEGQRALTADGHYSAANGGDMSFDIDIPGLPLTLAGVFVDPGTASLSGNAEGHLSVRGTPSSPHVEGEIGFRGGQVEVGMIGTRFGISDDRIIISGDRIDFNGFGLIAPNNARLHIDGDVDITDFRRMQTDLNIHADGFRAVDSERRGGSQIFGRADLDIDVTARGPFDGMTVRGGVDILRSTDITYALRSANSQVSDQRQDIVTFTVFADSLDVAVADTVVSRRRATVDLLVGVDIESGMRATLNLDETGENRAEVTGEGSLTYSMNAQGDMRLTGRYELSGGTVYYKPPIISQKVFEVREGSFVEWRGDPADPAFSISATQTMRVTIEEGGAQRDVSFEITISLAGSLEKLEIVFDLAAPSDISIQNQLLSLSAEQRMQQALSLLLYGRYTGPGVTTQGGLDARDQLNAFISRELNRWARSALRGVDFSVGIDTQSDATGNQHTNYSYSVSKRLFSDRVRVTVGGSVNDNVSSSRELRENIIDDITLEYRLTERDNMFLKVYRSNTQESILEGEVVETGAGFLLRKRMNRVGDLFRLTEGRRQRRDERRERREEQRAAREEARAARKQEKEQSAAPGDNGGEPQKTTEE